MEPTHDEMTTTGASALDLAAAAREINAAHEAVEHALRDVLAHARAAGERLLAVKGVLPHGAFMPWVAANCAFAHRTATLYMRVAREWEANWQRVATLREAAALLAAPAEGDAPREGREAPELPCWTAPVVVPVARLKAHPRNYREHPPEQLAHLVASIRTVGLYRPVVVARDNTILAGHGLVAAARLAGLTTVPVARLDLDPHEPAALKVLAGDNEIGTTAFRDDRKATDMLREVADAVGLEGSGFDRMQLAALVLVHRPVEEIPDLDAAATWAGAGMPEHWSEPLAKAKLVVLCRSREDRDAAARRLGYTGNAKRFHDTLSIWWPEPMPRVPQMAVWFGVPADAAERLAAGDVERPAADPGTGGHG